MEFACRTLRLSGVTVFTGESAQNVFVFDTVIITDINCAITIVNGFTRVDSKVATVFSRKQIT